MEWLVENPEPLAVPRRLGFSAPGREDWVVLPLPGDRLFLMAYVYGGCILLGSEFDAPDFKERMLRAFARPSSTFGVASVLIPRDHEECAASHVISWFDARAREHGFHVSTHPVDAPAAQILDQLKLETACFEARSATRH